MSFFTRPLVLLAYFAALPLVAHPGWGLVETPDGRLYVADVLNNTVWEIHPNGTSKMLVQGRHSHALCFDSHGVLWGDHTDYDPQTKNFQRTTWRLDGTRAMVATGACPGATRGRLQIPSEIPRAKGWEIWAFQDTPRGTAVLEHAEISAFEQLLKSGQVVSRLRLIPRQGPTKILWEARGPRP
ncbi:MAG: hypothetical protein OHK0021_23290 [Bryobacter sp.]